MSTEVEVTSGICGFKTRIKAVKGDGKNIRLSLVSDCEMVARMQEEVAELDMMAAFIRFLDNPVYRSASRCLKHVACPVPSGILKALEVEAGLCLPKNASIVFIKES
ncbi:MAG: hypothetical protein GTO55_02795 [Armatimonadetes bacterium]|nr:hypothetical protein [Armatimonadota bacterium]NIM23204.1 hypothetical protein [Armatimonadota bacterium]NIM67072.1 hypothetical protein [Armatimonadota bacterium]NIN05261.1 hypothetical protein [Armatimonadota bacterium]NIO96336.1 hypothetical protein [Armatimonadota bacterium]